MEERLVTHHRAHAVNFEILQRLKQEYFDLIVRKNSAEATSKQMRPIIVFMAFTIESYINSVGFRFIHEWNSIERKSLRFKLDKLRNIKKGEFETNEEIESSIEEIFSFRDDLAHGKPQVAYGPWIAAGKFPEDLAKVAASPNPVLSYGRLKTCEKIFHSFEIILAYIGSMADLNDDDAKVAYLNEKESREMQDETISDSS
jgi:hypothetical protein